MNLYINSLPQKGYLAYEYNPFYNYLTNVDLYSIGTDVGKVLVPKGCGVVNKNGRIVTKYGGLWKDSFGNIYSGSEDSESDGEVKISGNVYAVAGSLMDLDTDKLNFDLEHPVDITIQPSYDGSVNLILNDDKNIPRLINSRFSAREKNTYEIVDRVGENDTNVYNSETFDKDTSLYFLYEKNPSVLYTGFVKGTLPVGLYCFYFTYCDADDNESDYIAETGLIPVFIGTDRDPFSMDGGIKNQLSNKGIKLKLDNLDRAYNYLKVYYVRYFADYLQNRVFECKKLYKKFPINSDILYLQITGYEDTEDIDANLLNISRFNPKSVLTQAQCRNILFFGNIVLNADDYKELRDCALRIYPTLQVVTNFNTVDNDYSTIDGTQGYYDSQNIYNSVGYFNLEYYRFGVVFIYLNGSLSNAYNTIGYTLDHNITAIHYDKEPVTTDKNVSTRNYISITDDGWITEGISGLSGEESTDLNNLNGRGVCKINYTELYDEKTIFGIKFTVPEEVQKHLKTLGIRGLFFVRQKCMPTILGQCYLMPMDELMEGPVLEVSGSESSKYYTECFVTQVNETTKEGGRIVTNSYDNRLYEYKHTNDSENSISYHAYAGICPDFLLNLPYYNQIFNGSSFKLQEVIVKPKNEPDYNYKLNKHNRFYRPDEKQLSGIGNGFQTVIINTVTEEVPTVAIKDNVYRLEMGETEEAFRFQWAEIDNGTYDAGTDGENTVNKATNLVRGKFSPYLAIYSNLKLKTGTLYNIFQDSDINITTEYQNRMDSSEPFYAISNRLNFDLIKTVPVVCWRGDCYINTFTFRLNRNFNDPSLPNNDLIIDKNTWKDNYRVQNPEDWSNISRSDLNAVLMGSWITFKVRSAMNYALRSEDHSYVSEEGLMGLPRSFYPRNFVLYRGENKMPDSYLYNDAYRASLGYKCYFVFNNVNYIKNSFSNRILYSAISILDSFKNNYRYSLSTYYRDYSQEYGGITRLIGFDGYLLVIFEHGIGLAPVNERILVGGSEGEPVHINTKNVLPEELTIISDTIGTLWSESVVKSEIGYVYGIDTISKKIWRVKGKELEIISDFKVNKFLIDNITLGERELYPIIGLKNVKSHYNNNKKDIMFTFYDDVYKDEEKVWNLCYNELLDEFVTFYSWVPSYSENIDTQYFSFDRNTSKYLSLINKCNYNIPTNTGVLVDCPVLGSNTSTFTLKYRSEGTLYRTVKNADGTVRNEPINGKELKEEETVTFKIEKDHWGNYKYIQSPSNSESTSFTLKGDYDFETKKVMLLEVTPQIIENKIVTCFPTETICLTLKSIIDDPYLSPLAPAENGQTATSVDISKCLTTDFYLHGLAGIFDVAENLYPTHWYGKYHPFEFEFIVNDKIMQQKIFTNLKIISNKAEPESFHFEIEGDNYEFSSDKRTMYFRQEATKNLYLNLGSDILYDRKFTDVIADPYTYELYYRGDGTSPYSSNTKNKYSEYKTNNRFNWDKAYPVENKGLVKQVKSTIFPLYYKKIDTYDNIYHDYEMMNGTGYDFKNLSGSEIIWNRDLNLFNIVTHVKNSPMDLVGRTRGNSRYLEGIWDILIPAILFMLKNEGEWPTADKYDYTDSYLNILRQLKIPPIVITNNQLIPSDIQRDKISLDILPNIYYNELYRGRNESVSPTPTPPADDTSPATSEPSEPSNTVPEPSNAAPTVDINNIVQFGWTYRKEAKIRDKWMKVRIRYSGKNLAVIHSLITLYNLSYS